MFISTRARTALSEDGTVDHCLLSTRGINVEEERVYGPLFRVRNPIVHAQAAIEVRASLREYETCERSFSVLALDINIFLIDHSLVVVVVIGNSNTLVDGHSGECCVRGVTGSFSTNEFQIRVRRGTGLND